MTGPRLPPGDYTVKIIKGDKTYEGKVTMIWDPASRHSIADRDMRHEKMMKAYYLLEELGYYDKQILDIHDKSSEKIKQGVKKSTHKSMDKLVTKMDEMHAEIVPLKLGGITGEKRLRERVADVYSAINGYGGRPTDTQIERLDLLMKSVDEMGKRIEDIINAELADINKSLEKEGMEAINVITREEFESMDD
jgi:hypothetical protein